jgi:hypothetical protein
MAPEQAVGGEADRRSDIYSLGASFYHVVTGRPPFEGDTPVAVLLKHVHEPLPSVRDRRPEVPAGVAAVIEKMMSKRPEDRYQSYADLLADIDRVKRGLAVESAPTVASRALPPPGVALSEEEKHSPLSAAAIFLILALGGLLVWQGARQISKISAGKGAKGVEGGFTAGGGGDGADRPGGGATSDGGDSSPATKTITVGTRTIPIPTYSNFDPAPMLTAALHTKTIAILKKIETSVKVYYNEKDRLPAAITDLTGYLEPDDFNDAWGKPITYAALDETLFRLHSSGPDGKDGTEDDINVEKKAVPDFPSR